LENEAARCASRNARSREISQMKNAPLLISFAAAGFYVCGVIFTIAMLVGAGEQRLLWFLTFGDFVNLATPVAFLLALIATAAILWISIWLIHPRCKSELTHFILDSGGESKSLVRTPYSRIEIIRLSIWIFIVVTAYCFLIYNFRLHSWPEVAIFTTSVVIAIATVSGTKYAFPQFPKRVIAIVIISLLLVNATVLSGLLYGMDSPPCSKSIVVTRSGNISGSWILPLERGVVKIENGSFTLIPWSQIQAILRKGSACAPTTANGARSATLLPK
jgi:hypothetical protein